METGREQAGKNELNEQKKKSPVGLIIVIVILLLAIAALAYLQVTRKKEMQVMERVLTSEKDSLARELSDLIYGYDTLRTENDSLNMRLELEQDKIRRLLAIQASNAEKIGLYKKELATLRNVMRSYIVQIDSLNTRNQLLTEENLEVRTRLQMVQTEKEELNQIREELSSKVEIASVIKAKDIVASPINRRGREKDKISKMEQLMVCFTLRENPIAAAGKRFIYLRIIRPDELLVTTSADNLFDFQGEKWVYSAYREVEYMNQDIEMCIYYDNDGQFIPGEYNMILYTDGTEIGSTSLLLK